MKRSVITFLVTTAVVFAAAQVNAEALSVTIQYGDGRCFHTTLGHDENAMNGVAFQVSLQRGTEWAATGKVTLPAVDQQVLTSEQPALRDPATIKPRIP